MAYKGKSTKELLGIDADEFLRLDKSQLKEIVSRVASTSNKRIKKLQKAGIETPATRRIAKSGGAFSVRGKTFNQLRAEYVRAKTFLQNETSTKKGYKKFVKQSLEKLGRTDVNLSEENYERFSRLFDQLKEIDPTVIDRQMRYKIMPELSKMVERGRLSDESILNRLERKVVELYEKQEQQSSVSDFFEL